MKQKVVIIGGGVIGLCSAYYAAKKGHSVTVLEREAPGHLSCSFGNAGMICPSHVVPLAAPGMIGYGLRTMWNPESPFYVRPRLSSALLAWGWRFWRASSIERVRRAAPVLRDLHMASRALFEELHETTAAAFHLERKGLMMLCKTQHALDEEAHAGEESRKLGIPCEVWDAKQTATRDPAMKMDVAGAVYYPKDCHFAPGAFMQVLESLAVKEGAEIHRGVSVRGWVTRGNTIQAVQTTNGGIDAESVVLASGIWSDGLARDLDLRIPMQAGKGYSVTLDKPRALPELCSILVEARVAVTPMAGKLRFGGTMELSGISTTTINERRVQGIVKSALNYFPDLRAEDFANVPAWTGMRPCSPDGLPYLGRTRRFENLIVATGHAMMGMSLGPITGKIVSEILSREKPGVEIALLDPERYSRS